MKKKIISFFEITIMIVSTFAFCFFIASGIPEVKADGSSASIPASAISQGCCLETKSGKICQNLNSIDAVGCKSALEPTSCEFLKECRIGCCYDTQLGSCSLNSPQEKCTSNGGTWSDNALCNIAECSLGCCVLGNNAAITDSRQCTLLAREKGFARTFTGLDSDGGCSSHVNLDSEGACLTSTGDFSGENDCRFTTKRNCKGDFKEGYLCTAKALNTTCAPSKNTTCLDSSDQIYYLDTCGNLANIYDASKFNDKNYWEKRLDRSAVCKPGTKDCGNCDYLTGSRCYKYRDGKDTKPIYGDNVCRNLNCANGKKNGESWCLTDYRAEGDKAISNAPVGSRQFIAKCLDGNIQLQGCADFNNEICIQNNNQGEFGAITEARCVTNEWRSCIAANQKDTYADVKTECDKYSQCIMYLDIPGNEGLKNKYPGFFDKETALGDKPKDDASYTTARGATEKVGAGINSVIPFCIPKETPGMVFWSISGTPLSGTTSSSSSTGASTQSLGGSYDELKAICSLGTFTCVEERYQDGRAFAQDQKRTNNICQNFPQEYIDALNDRCKALGPCGIKINVAGKLGSNDKNVTSRIHINTEGKQENYNSQVSSYKVSDIYLESLVSKTKTQAPGTITSLLNLASAIFVLTGKATATDTQIAAGQASSSVQEGQQSALPLVATGGGSLAVAGLLRSTSVIVGTSSQTVAIVPAVGYVVAAAIAGYVIGTLIGKAFGMSAYDTKTLAEVLGAGLGAAYAGYYIATASGAGTLGATLTFGIAGVIVAAIMLYHSLTTYEEYEYWVTTYSCEPWQPPRTGDCNSCNKDVRQCSEYRCRSLGQNCQYFNQNGEPGYCTTMDDIWSAQISPWDEALTTGLKYTDVTSSRFSITQKNGENLEAGAGITFGIKTDKPATCKMDVKHTASYEEMSTSFVISSPAYSTEEAQNMQAGLYHKIALSVYSAGSQSTMGLKTGENNFYIRCRNFAGQVNTAEFPVRINVKQGPDLSPPYIVSFDPIEGTYIGFGKNSTTIRFYVNEPAECKFTNDASKMDYGKMDNTAVCLTSGDSGFLGQWPCSATLNNLGTGDNKFYFACKDQPKIDARISNQRNTGVARSYYLNGCSKGLNITSLSPKNTIITGKSGAGGIELRAETSGCIAGGEATCYFKIGNQLESPFYETGSTTHYQKLSSIDTGNYEIAIRCEDIAGNSATDTAKVNITIHDTPPIITRAFVAGKQVIVSTDEQSTCRYTTNESYGCDFSFDLNSTSTEMTGDSIQHFTGWVQNKNYYIKCKDAFDNVNAGCGVVLETY